MTRRRPPRWLRLVLPLAVVLAVGVTTLVMHALQQPDRADPDFLNPASTAPIGAATLAGTLTGRGVQIDVVRDGGSLLRAAGTGDATVLVPAPDFVPSRVLRALPALPAGTRVVLVQPSAATAYRGRLPLALAGSRWATAAVPPACTLPEATGAGTAAVYHDRYRVGPDQAAGEPAGLCYGGALARLDLAGVEVIVAGATEPFRNDRAGEYGNAALAAALLGTHHRLVWLDRHTVEPPPPRQPQQQQEEPPGSGAPAPDQPGLPLPGWAGPVALLLAGAALLAALAAGRRLGPPVFEPLPVLVRPAETVRGRGRLYQRARARGPALDALRAATRQRLRTALAVPPHGDLAAGVAARTGRDVGQVRAILAGAAPRDDTELRALVRALDELEHDTLAGPSGARGGTGGWVR